MNYLHVKVLKNMTLSVASAALMLVSVGSATAQDGSTNERIAKIENLLSKLPTISGMVNTRLQYSDLNDDVKFDLRRARLDVKGDISKAFDYRLFIEFASSARVLDAYFRWKPTKSFNMQFGQFKLPFSLENIYNPMTVETVENAVVINKLCGYSDEAGVGANGRDIGLAFYGGLFHKEGYNVIDYALGLFNGNGINTTDNNKSKDFSGRLTLNPTKELSFAVSYLNGLTTRTLDGLTDDYQRVRTGIGARYDNKKLLVRSEYITGKTGSRKSDGFYLTAALLIAQKLQPVVKFDFYQSDKSNNDSRLCYYTAGINYYPVKKLRLQLNYTYRDIKTKTDENYIVAQAIMVF